MTETVRTHLRVRASELVGRNWLNTGGKSLDLESLRGKIVLLDFWTFCCINCLHVLDELRPLEQQYSDVLVTVGVHSPKFEHEADPVALAAAVERYEIRHPVLDDPELDTWKAYTARAWPTLVVIDPEGYIVAHLSGEGHADGLAVLIPELIAEHEAKGTLHRGDGPYVAPEPTSGTLRFPGKALFLPDGRGVGSASDAGSWLVTDTGHHRLVELSTDFQTVLATYGSGDKGHADGNAATARFNEPQGLVLLPDDVAAETGYDVVIADSVNHRLRGLSLDGRNRQHPGRQRRAAAPRDGTGPGGRGRRRLRLPAGGGSAAGFPQLALGRCLVHQTERRRRRDGRRAPDLQLRPALRRRVHHRRQRPGGPARRPGRGSLVRPVLRPRRGRRRQHLGGGLRDLRTAQTRDRRRRHGHRRVRRRQGPVRLRLPRRAGLRGPAAAPAGRDGAPGRLGGDRGHVQRRRPPLRSRPRARSPRWRAACPSPPT